MPCHERWIYCYDPETKRHSSQLKQVSSPRTKKARQSKSTYEHFMIPFSTVLAWSTCTGFPLDWQSTRNTILRFCVQGEIPSEEASTLQIGSVAFPLGQWSSPQLHPCHILFDQDGHQFLTLPINQTFLPVTFCYSLSSDTLVLRRW